VSKAASAASADPERDLSEQAQALETKVKGASDELAAQNLYRYSGLNLVYWRHQQYLACGCCIALPTLGMRGTVWRLGLEQTCGPIREPDT
jgi:hypothetical protein